MKKKSQPLVSRTANIPSTLPAGYPVFLDSIKSRIRTVQVRAALAANAELIRLYWSIGRDLVEKQTREGWGAKIVERLATDLHRAFPDLGGFSRTNLYRMRAFYLAWPEADTIVPRPVGQSAMPAGSKIVPRPVGQLAGAIRPLPVAELPWSHNVILIEKIAEPAERLWYAAQAIQSGWSRDVLELQIETGLHHRQGRAVTNFSHTLPQPQSDLAQQILKDPYVFDFLTLAGDARERELEDALTDHLRDFLLELGAGFAFVGRQVRLEVGGEDFAIDLLFYHLKLRCYVVIDLKARAFIPEDAGKMNFYLSAADDLLRHPQDQPSIGLLLCREKPGRRLVLEYALRDMRKPIGVSHYQLTRALPANLKASLPSVEEIEAELARELAPAARRKPKARASRRAQRKGGGKK